MRDKIETPEEFADRVVVEYRSGPYSLRKVLLDTAAARDALLCADERQKAAERAMEAVGNIPPFQRSEWELMDSRIRAAILAEPEEAHS